jgi:hypothetical protein
MPITYAEGSSKYPGYPDCLVREVFLLSGVRTNWRCNWNLKHAENRQVGSSRCHGTRTLWNNVWKLPVPQKVWIFAWRLSNNGLATLRSVQASQ